jgi:hypothetical protein
MPPGRLEEALLWHVMHPAQPARLAEAAERAAPLLLQPLSRPGASSSLERLLQRMLAEPLRLRIQGRRAGSRGRERLRLEVQPLGDIWCVGYGGANNRHTPQELYLLDALLAARTRLTWTPALQAARRRSDVDDIVVPARCRRASVRARAGGRVQGRHVRGGRRPRNAGAGSYQTATLDPPWEMRLLALAHLLAYTAAALDRAAATGRLPACSPQVWLTAVGRAVAALGKGAVERGGALAGVQTRRDLARLQFALLLDGPDRADLSQRRLAQFVESLHGRARRAASVAGSRGGAAQGRAAPQIDCFPPAYSATSARDCALCRFAAAGGPVSQAGLGHEAGLAHAVLAHGRRQRATRRQHGSGQAAADAFVERLLAAPSAQYGTFFPEDPAAEADPLEMRESGAVQGATAED